MPFAGINGMVSRRTLEAQELRRACAVATLSNNAKRAIRGLIYITLYGMYERAVASCVETALDVANGHLLPIASLKDGIQLFALRPDLDSYRGIGFDKSWQRGLLLLAKLRTSAAARMEFVFPADGSFMRPSQLKLIWDLFDLPGEPWPEPRLMGLIHELVDARNHVAHGTETAGERGGRLSDNEMDDRIRDIETLCIHIVGAFSSQLAVPAGFVR